MKVRNYVYTAVVIAATVQVFAQGSLTPPGAPGESMKTLEQIEPRTDVLTLSGDAGSTHVIDQPGSYYLSGNVTNVSTTYGIYINATNVTLDLNGFTLSGAGGSRGIYITSGGNGAAVRNGHVSGFTDGINASPAESCLYEDLSASGCSSDGMYLGDSSRIINCRAFNNAGTGIDTGTASSLTGCTAYNNKGSYGIRAGYGSTLTDCAAYNNEGTGAIYASSGSILSGCSAYDNDVTYGLGMGTGGRMVDCSAYANTGSGSSSYGIYASGFGLISGCVSLSNNHTNSPGTSVQGCGIYAGPSATIKNCNVTFNEGDGIRISNDSLIIGNNCESNGNGGDGAGIHVTSGDTRIENNNVTDNDRGIDVDVSGCMILKNSAAGNTVNYDIVANNVFGTIVDRTAPASAAVSGDSAASSAGTTDPWANFSY